MASRLEVSSGGGSSLLIEVSDDSPGAKRVSRDHVLKKIDEEELAARFSRILSFVRQSAATHAPSSLEIELALGVTAEGNFIIVKAEGSATIKLTAKWIS